MSKCGLVLTGGGARSAYQVGVLKGISDICKSHKNLFEVISGVSAGAINGSYLVSYADDPYQGVQNLWDLWANLNVSEIYKSDSHSMFKIGFRLIKDMSTGGLLRGHKSNYLLDTAPLYEFLKKNLDIDRIRNNIENKKVHAFAVTATNFHSGTCVTFYEGASEIKDWVRTNRVSRREQITLDHIMASAAIPIFFPPVRVSKGYYGDGVIRMNSPLSPAVHMGADKILAIGIRYKRSLEEVIQMNKEQKENVSLAEIAGVMLNAAFLSFLDSDIERIERINRTLELIPPTAEAHTELRKIPILEISPSKDLGNLACDQFTNFPKILKHALRGIGATEKKGWDLISYLAFEKPYTTMLLDLGYQDAMRKQTEIEEFFKEDL